MGSNFILVILVFTEIACQIPFYQCPAFAIGYNLPEGVCAKKAYINNTTNLYNWQFRNCSEGQICAFNPSQSISNCVTIVNSNSSLPGENCTINSDCLSNSCNNLTKRCVGKGYGENCNHTNECGVGLFCVGFSFFQKSCNELIPVGGSCYRNNLCVGNAVCINHTCIRFQTVPYGGQADNYFLCKGNYTVYPDSVNGINRCRSPLTLINPLTQCDLGTVCVYKADNYSKSIPCRCGVNSSQNPTKGVCPYGSKDLTKYMDNFMNFTNSIWKDTPKCHINNPFFCSNVANETGYYEAYVGLLYFHDNLYLNNASQNSVLKSILRYDYWNAYSKIQLPSPAFSLPLSSLICKIFLTIMIFI